MRIRFIIIATVVIISSAILARYIASIFPLPQENQGMIRLCPKSKDITEPKRKNCFIRAECTPINQRDNGRSEEKQNENHNSSGDYEPHFLPEGKSGDYPQMRLCDTAQDGTYGYAEGNPIKVGGDGGSGPRNERMFLNALYGSNGEIITYQRLGSCCPFKTENGFLGTGLLDIYKIHYEGLGRPVTLLLNMYDYEEPKVPCGFSTILLDKDG